MTSLEREPEMRFDSTAVVERLPSEKPVPRPSPLALCFRLVVRAVLLAFLFLVTMPLWPIYWVARLIWGRPPNVPRLGQIRRYLKLTWTERPPPPGLPLLWRLWLTLSIVRKLLVTPLWGLAWILDQALYGRALRRTPIDKPLFEISAGRSGSTQLAHYLEDDDRLIAPTFLQSLFPYLWLWRLAPRLAGRFISREAIRVRAEASVPKEFLERHEADPFRTDTFDVALYLAHLNHLSPLLGPSVAIDDFGFAVVAPHNELLWRRDFLELVDGIARKTLLQAGPAPTGEARRFFLKGHFLCAADALEARYPDARFLAVIREPAPRFRSAINYLRTNPFDRVLGPVPWAWLCESVLRAELRYCEVEREFFTRENGRRRCVLRFSEYVRDLEGALGRVYRECLGFELPANRPIAHTDRKRTAYLVNRSLAELGIDEGELSSHLAAYLEWCRNGGQGPA